MKPAAMIIGAGPVGLTMALQLTHYGVPVRIVDKNAGRTDKSKALVLWSRTLELLDRGDYAAVFVDTGLKVTAAGIYAGGRRIAHITLDQIQASHPYALMVPQSDTERILEQHLNRLGVNVERQVELLQFVAGPDQISATLRHADGREENLQIPWLIGCDGAHSAVRRGLGMQFQGNTLESDWILADVYLTGLTDNANEISIYWQSSGVLAIFPISPGRYRIIADVGDVYTDQPRPDPTLEEVQAIIDQRGPGNITASSPIWLASFRINERKVKDYRAGRVFLAGDAAHVHSPAGGQGMNTGMQDACNLSWKLALVHHGLAGEEPLLGSFSIERSAVGDQVLKDAGRLTMVATIRSHALQHLRDHVASLAFGLSSVRHAMANKLSEITIGYAHSPLTIPSHSCRPAAGERAPVSGSERSSEAGSPPRFALFARVDSEGEVVIKRFAQLLDPKIQPPFHDDRIWLVRPDGYVALVAERGDWSQINDYLKRLCAPRF